MSITAKCAGCGAQYQADERFAGRTVKCRHCGATFTVAAPASARPPQEEDPLEALAAMEQTAPQQLQPKQSRWSSRPAATAPTGGYEFASPKATRSRGPRRQNQALAEMTDIWLPRALVIVFYGPLLILGVMAAFNGPVPPVFILLQAIGLGLLVFMVLPIAAAGMRVGANMMNVRVRDDEARFKIFAAFAPTPAIITLATIMVFGTGGALELFHHLKTGYSDLSGRLILGFLLGFGASFFLIWVMFHLRIVEALVAWVFTMVFYFLGMALAAFILVLIAIPVGMLLTKTHHALPWDTASQIATTTPTQPPPNQVANSQPRPSDDQVLKDKAEQNLRQIGQAALRVAAASPDGLLPRTLDLLVAQGNLPPQAVDSPFQALGGRGYHYLGPRYTTMPVNVILAYDEAELAALRGTHVLFVNGDVRWVDAAGLDPLITESTAAVDQWRDSRIRTAQANERAASHMVDANPDARPGRSSTELDNFVTEFDKLKSPLVAEVKSAEFADDASEIVHPLTTSPYLGVVKSSDNASDVFQVWNTVSGQKESEATFPHETVGQVSYALSPDGSMLARITHWPKLSLRIWSFKDAQETHAIDLDPRFGEATIDGFLEPKAIAVRRQVGAAEGFEVYSSFTGKLRNHVPIEQYERSAGNGVVSPDGRFFAVITSASVRGVLQPWVHFYDMEGDSRSVAKFRGFLIKGWDASTITAPAGMAFSPDGRKLAALFERGSEGLILCWQFPNGKPLGQAQVAVAPHFSGVRGPGRPLAWIHDGTDWLVTGDLIVDATSGGQTGKLNAPATNGQWPTGPDTLLLSYDAAAKCHLALVKLDASKFPVRNSASPAGG